jgi:hypothetical protein
MELTNETVKSYKNLKNFLVAELDDEQAETLIYYAETIPTFFSAEEANYFFTEKYNIQYIGIFTTMTYILEEKLKEALNFLYLGYEKETSKKVISALFKMYEKVKHTNKIFRKLDYGNTNFNFTEDSTTLYCEQRTIQKLVNKAKKVLKNDNF